MLSNSWQLITTLPDSCQLAICLRQMTREQIPGCYPGVMMPVTLSCLPLIVTVLLCIGNHMILGNMGSHLGMRLCFSQPKYGCAQPVLFSISWRCPFLLASFCDFPRFEIVLADRALVRWPRLVVCSHGLVVTQNPIGPESS